MPRRGGGSSRGKGSGGGSVPRDVQVSKAMSWLLRHGAKGEGIKMDQNGYISVADLLAWPRVRSLSLTFPELQEIVASNEKQRFSMIPLPSTNSEPPGNDPSRHLIRANQGHSLAIFSEDLLKPVLPSDPDFPRLVVHGTNEEAWRGIKKSEGLKRMNRRHVHFARGVPGDLGKGSAKGKIEGAPSNESADNAKAAATEDGRGNVVVGDQGTEEALPPDMASEGAAKVISGMRANATVLIWVDVERSLNEGGLEWWRSDNGVILTEGDGQGFVRMEWVDRVERRGTGEILWTRAKD